MNWRTYQALPWLPLHRNKSSMISTGKCRLERERHDDKVLFSVLYTYGSQYRSSNHLCFVPISSMMFNSKNCWTIPLSISVNLFKRTDVTSPKVLSLVHHLYSLWTRWHWSVESSIVEHEILVRIWLLGWHRPGNSVLSKRITLDWSVRMTTVHETTPSPSHLTLTPPMKIC